MGARLTGPKGLMSSLPFDLERLIFEIAASQDTDHNSRVRLILVSRRVYEWIRPLLYRVAITRGTAAPTVIRHWKDTQIPDVAPFVRHLLLTSHAIELLSTFYNVENLGIWLGPSLTSSKRYSNTEYFQKMKDLPLRTLSVVLMPIRLHEAISSFSEFRTLTHLEIITTRGLTWNDCNAVAIFQKLTHFSLSSEDADGQFVRDLLEHCPYLRVMIYQPPDRCAIETDDPRLLVFRDSIMSVDDFIEEWERSANGQIGLWELADLIMEARKDKLFEDESSFTFSRMTWMDGLNDDGRRRYKEWLRADHD